MFENQVRKLPTGIKVIAIIQIVLSISAIGLYFSVFNLTESNFITIVMLLCAIIIVGASLILAKKKVGVFIYFINYIIYYIYIFSVLGITKSFITGLILNIVFLRLILKDKDVFGL